MKLSRKTIIILLFFFNYSLLTANEEIETIFFANLLNFSKLNYDNKFDSKINLLNFNYYSDTTKNTNDSSLLLSDSLNNQKDTSKYIPKNEFIYADDSKYTLTGELPLKETNIKLLPTAIVGTTTLGIFIIQHELQQNTIWKEVGKFHFAEDIQYALWADKFGHFYGGYFIGYLFNEALLTCGFSDDLSTILGGVLSLSYQTYVEMLDGMSVNWGFSPSDFYADLIGSAYYVAQKYVPVLQNFTPKFSYVNPKWLGEKDRNPHESFIDNYSAQNFWMSINIRNLIGGSTKRYLPDWLQLSVGYAAYSLCSPGSGLCDPKVSTPISNDVWGNPRIIVALDYDLVKLLPDGPPIWNWFKQSLNYIKFPAPALEFRYKGRTRFYLLYPFSIF